MPKPIQHGDDYDSDPEVQAEKEMAKKDPVGYAIDANSLTSQKKMAAANGKDEVSTTPPNVIGNGGAAGAIAGVPRSKSQDDVAKKQKAANQSKALKKQRSRGISGCSSRKFSGFDGDDYEMEIDNYDGYDPQEFDEDEEDHYIRKH
ncbi:hypothetical protein B9Z55_016935 [Caenorhabditis nigoni]|uniref:Uncharacterized protein n=1 Tax=Caenorhabditis nigoni TaxID=1611254 RepID=A0A2G5T7I7_9PELO|nr:hypothetical protein B9Z55_016935 [Caenorhabditis nigoni]